MQLASKLNAFGVARTHPNPYFEAFAAALARRTPYEEMILTKQELDAQAKLADEVLSEPFEEEQTDAGGDAAVRYISLRNQKPDPEWVKKASSLISYLKAAADSTARNNIIDDNRKLALPRPSRSRVAGAS